MEIQLWLKRIGRKSSDEGKKSAEAAQNVAVEKTSDIAQRTTMARNDVAAKTGGLYPRGEAIRIEGKAPKTSFSSLVPVKTGITITTPRSKSVVQKGSRKPSKANFIGLEKAIYPKKPSRLICIL